MKCLGRLSAPFSRPGYFISIIDPAVGLACPSKEACPGGSNRTGNASCAPGYAGDRCSQCTEGSYLLYNQCHPCGKSALIWIFSVGLPVLALLGATLIPPDRLLRLLHRPLHFPTRTEAVMRLVGTLGILIFRPPPEPSASRGAKLAAKLGASHAHVVEQKHPAASVTSPQTTALPGARA